MYKKGGYMLVNRKRSLSIIVSLSIVFVAILFYVEQVVQVPYIYKTILKIPLFLIFPFFIKRFMLKEKMSFKIELKNLRFIILISIGVIGIIAISFIIVKSFIDPSLIISDFQNRMKITKTMFVFAGFYTIIGNSFIEEYFFRGFIFQGLHNKGLRKTAYLLSASLFAFYHIGIFMSWFTIPIMLLVLFGLFVGGLIFSYFVQKTHSVLASYIIHMSADLVIVLIGIFGIGLFS